jgi:hypothetical protein
MDPSRIIGASITGVFWTSSTVGGNARYFATLSTGSTLELQRDGIAETTLPIEATSMKNEFGPVLGGPGIAGVFFDGLGELAIVLLSGHYLHLFGTFDGRTTGNNFVLNSPPHEEDWVGEIQRDWRRIC